jgi:DNA-binding CsgD family transcriptional regulator
MLLGRAQECARLDALLASALQGQSGALVLRGEAGIGKTALLDYAASRADGFRVLRATGVEAESSLAFSGLLQLVRPILDAVDDVPPAQAEALGRALGLVDPGEADPFLAYSATLHLLAASGETVPLLCLVDDAHWLDQASAEGVTFAARRLEADRVALVLAVRRGEDESLDTRGIDEIELGGLDDVPARELLAQSGAGPLAPPVASRLIAATGGNPLALVEVPPGLNERQRAGREPLDDPLAVGESVERAFLVRVGGLSADARRVLLLAAASDGDDLAPVARAAGPAASALDEAEAAGLARVRGERLAFRHPLVRSAIYSAATAGERRAAHAALADALGEEDADRRAWHLSAAAIGPDAAIAAALDEAADRAHQRGGLAAEARLLERSAMLTPDRGERVPRLLRAGTAAYGAGLADEAMALLEDGLASVDEPLARADLHEARAYVLRAQGRPAESVETCLAEADRVEPFDSLRAANLLSRVEEFLQEQFDMDGARELAARIRALLGEHRGPAAVTAMAQLSRLDTLDARSDALTMASDGARLELERDRLSEGAVDFAESLIFLERYSEARQLLEAAVSNFRRRGAVVDLIRALAALVALELRSGSIARASVAANEAVQLSVEGGLDYWEAWSLARLASVDAVLGPEEKGRAHAVRSAELATQVRDRESESHAYDALGRLELGLGNAEAAVRALERTAELLEPVRHTNYVLWAPDLVEAYVRAGRRDDALRLNERFGELAALSGTALATASAARCRALLADEEEFEAAFADALQLARAEGVPGFERARTELLWGERLRRSGLRIEAREQLRSALDEFDRIGAASWADMAREELRASGETARPRDPSLVDQLTPRELEIALLAADGLTNKEIGARLFLSPKTAELHLGRVYRKLGIRSRTELARAIPGR